MQEQSNVYLAFVKREDLTPYTDRGGFNNDSKKRVHNKKV
ncbi:hypothetical protein ES705_11293 [subsurface metagenome]